MCSPVASCDRFQSPTCLESEAGVSKKADQGMLVALVVGGAAAVIGWFYMVNKSAAQAAPANGTGAVIRFQPDRRRLSGWGSYGTPGFSGGGGRGTGAAIYWRRVS